MSTYYFVYDWIQCGSLKEITDWLRNSDRKVAVRNWSIYKRINEKKFILYLFGWGGEECKKQ